MKLNKLIILIGIAIIAMCVLKKMGVVEEFYCQNCNQNGWRGESSCATCGNCGWCIDPNGSGSCVSGTAAGPLFADCSSWYYGGQCQWGAECDGVRPGYHCPRSSAAAVLGRVAKEHEPSAARNLGPADLLPGRAPRRVLPNSQTRVLPFQPGLAWGPGFFQGGGQRREVPKSGPLRRWTER